MEQNRRVKRKGANMPPASRYRDELEPPPTAPGQPQQTQGIAPSSSKVGEDVERPQYGNVIRRSLDHDESKDEGGQLTQQECEGPSDDQGRAEPHPPNAEGITEQNVRKVREWG